VAAGAKYFVWNKESDFSRGWSNNLVWSEGSLKLKSIHSAGVFFSHLLDSREKQSTWQRIRLRAKSPGDSSILVTFYASESRLIPTESGEMDLNTAIRLELDQEEKKRQFAGFRVKTIYNPSDALLYEITGRFVWFCIELFGQGEESPILEHIRIDLPRTSWVGYLPEIYQSAPGSKAFLERYLCIFQSIYDDLEEEIKRLPARFDPDVAEGDFLQWLAEWLALEDGYMWKEDKLRYLLQNAMVLYAQRGTRRGISEIVALYIGETPYIVEQHQLEPFCQDPAISAHMRRLYGDSGFLFTVVVSERAVPDVATYRTLLKIIEHAKPAHMEVNVVVLKPYIFLDKYSYLGINSVLGQYRALQLDGYSALPFTGLMSV
jgi:phage tail-like protein